MPALATDVVCCSIASCMLALRGGKGAAPWPGHRVGTWKPYSPTAATEISHFEETADRCAGSRLAGTQMEWECTSWLCSACLPFSGMPSNSSMRHTPPSASTSAPASSVHPPESCQQGKAAAWLQGRLERAAGQTERGVQLCWHKLAGTCRHGVLRSRAGAGSWCHVRATQSQHGISAVPRTCTADAVRPALVVARPLVMTAREASLETYLPGAQAKPT